MNWALKHTKMETHKPTMDRLLLLALQRETYYRKWLVKAIPNPCFQDNIKPKKKTNSDSETKKQVQRLENIPETCEQVVAIHASAP